MKNKKGFTLIELLAVIAILAILVVLTVPNILGMFNKGKVSAFVTQAKQIFDSVEASYTTDMIDGGEVSLTYCNDGTKSLPEGVSVSSDNKVKYFVTINSEGKITKFQISDGTYGYNLTTSVEKKDITDKPLTGTALPAISPCVK
ncbi:MAG: type II secretion system protein [Bacilli bacterium]